MGINVSEMSQELRELVVKNGKIDLTKLNEIATSREGHLAEEASKLLQSELNGGKTYGDIGDKLETTSTVGGQKPEAVDSEVEGLGILKKAGQYISDWWTDKDKISTDGNDDGQISIGEKAESFGKGLVGGLVKNIAKNPVESAVVIGGTAAAAYGATAGLAALGVAAAGPIVAGALVLVGVGFGVSAIYKGLNGAKESDTDGATKSGFEEAGTGAAMVALSGLGARRLSKSGAKAAENTKITEPVEAVESAKTAPITEAPKPVEAVEVKASDAVKLAEVKSVETKTKTMTLTEMQRKATLDKAGFTEDVIAQLKNEEFSYGAGQRENTLRIVEYLERQIAEGKKITPELIHEAIKACDDVYAQPGYGRLYQSEQMEVINKYWSRADEVRAVYQKEGRFFTESEKIAMVAAKRKATLDKAGFTEDVIAQLKNEEFSYGAGQRENTLRMVEYLEGRLAKGEKLSYMMVREAIKACDDVYAQPGYGRLYQDEQLGVLAKYWVHGQELMDVYK